MLIYIIIFFLIAFFAVEYELGNRKLSGAFIALTILLILFAGLRNPFVPKDYLVYEFIFDNIGKDNMAGDNISKSLEPGFYGLILLFKSLFTNYYTLAIMICCAVVAVTLHSLSFHKYSFNPFLALLIYYSNFFFLHEMVQIRIGISISIILVSLPLLINKKYLAFGLLVIFATLFHYSAILALSFFFFKNQIFNKKFYAALLIFALPFGMLNLGTINIFEVLSIIDSANPKLSNYSNTSIMGLDAAANLFNVMNLMSIVIAGYLLYVIPKEDLLKDNYLSLFLKCEIVSIFIFCATSSNALIAFRVSEVFSIFSIFLFVYLTKYLPFKKLNIWLVIGIALIFLSLNIFDGDFIKPYRIYDFS
ncbi:MAG: EpsG family protein [Chitinophagaceae bacterium]|nr:EpsG family protein [Chitinophagaceae bacterium]MCZ2396329.1 EpsG family protein [Chitinophagales bacterium]